MGGLASSAHGGIPWMVKVGLASLMTSASRQFSAGAVLFAAAMFVSQAAGAEVAPKRGGVLEFASTVEPGNYDCHGNTSFAFCTQWRRIIRRFSNSTLPTTRKSSVT